MTRASLLARQHPSIPRPRRCPGTLGARDLRAWDSRYIGAIFAPFERVSSGAES
jgi:hypothetical protein